MIHPLHSLAFEWHDLPVERLTVTDRGVVIDVLPFNDDAGHYDHATLSLVDAESIAFDVQGELSLGDFDGLQIMKLDVAESAPGRVSGTLGILPGDGGYWTIHVTNAVWQVKEHGPAGVQFPKYA